MRRVTAEVVAVLTEDMHPPRVERHRDVVARLQRRVGVGADLHGRASRCDRQVEVGAHRLEKRDAARDAAFLAGRPDLDVLRTQSELRLTARLDLVLELGGAEDLCGERHVDIGAAKAPASVDRLEHAGDQVHRRRSEERGDEDVRRTPVDVLWRADLLQDAVVHHCDPVAHGHRLDLIVRDVHRRDPELGVQLDQLEARLDAELRVEVGERLVHQERLGLAHDRAGQRDSLALPSRELPRKALEQVVKAQDPRSTRDRGIDLVLRLLGDLERKGNVLGHRHVRIEGVVLEHHRHVALDGIDEVHEPVSDHDLTCIGVFEAGDDAEDRALPASGRAEQDEELAVGDPERDVADRLDLAETLYQVLDQDLCHCSPCRSRREQSFTA